MISTSIADEFRAIVGSDWFLDTPEDLNVVDITQLVLQAMSHL